MINGALFVRLEATPGKEEEVASFLRQGLSWSGGAVNCGMVWLLGLGIFDPFPDEADQAPLHVLKEKASNLFSQPPRIEKADVLVSRLAQQVAKAA